MLRGGPAAITSACCTCAAHPVLTPAAACVQALGVAGRVAAFGQQAGGSLVAGVGSWLQQQGKQATGDAARSPAGTAAEGAAAAAKNGSTAGSAPAADGAPTGAAGSAAGVAVSSPQLAGLPQRAADGVRQVMQQLPFKLPPAASGLASAVNLEGRQAEGTGAGWAASGSLGTRGGASELPAANNPGLMLQQQWQQQQEALGFTRLFKGQQAAQQPPQQQQRAQSSGWWERVPEGGGAGSNQGGERPAPRQQDGAVDSSGGQQAGSPPASAQAGSTGDAAGHGSSGSGAGDGDLDQHKAALAAAVAQAGRAFDSDEYLEDSAGPGAGGAAAGSGSNEGRVVVRRILSRRQQAAADRLAAAGEGGTSGGASSSSSGSLVDLVRQGASSTAASMARSLQLPLPKADAKRSSGPNKPPGSAGTARNTQADEEF